MGSFLTDRRHTAARINYSVMLHAMLVQGNAEKATAAIERDINTLSTYLLVQQPKRNQTIIKNLIEDLTDKEASPHPFYLPPMLRSMEKQTGLVISPPLKDFLERDLLNTVKQ